MAESKRLDEVRLVTQNWVGGWPDNYQKKM